MTELELAGYLDRRLSGAERERVSTHLVTCAECRQEAIAVEDLLTRSRRPRRIALVTLLVGAAALFFVVMGPSLWTRLRSPEPFRQGEVVPALVAYGPSGEVPGDGVRFVWGLAPAATSYRLTVSGADGVPLWSMVTPDTLLPLPGSIRLEPDRPYYWMADALLDDGTTRSTGLREFRVRP